MSDKKPTKVLHLVKWRLLHDSDSVDYLEKAWWRAGGHDGSCVLLVSVAEDGRFHELVEFALASHGTPWRPLGQYSSAKDWAHAKGLGKVRVAKHTDDTLCEHGMYDLLGRLMDEGDKADERQAWADRAYSLLCRATQALHRSHLMGRETEGGAWPDATDHLRHAAVPHVEAVCDHLLRADRLRRDG